MCTMPHSYARHELFIWWKYMQYLTSDTPRRCKFVPWTRVHVWHDSYTCVKCFIHLLEIAWFTCVTKLIHTCRMPLSNIRHDLFTVWHKSYAWDDSYTCVKCLFLFFDMTLWPVSNVLVLHDSCDTRKFLTCQRVMSKVPYLCMGLDYMCGMTHWHVTHCVAWLIDMWLIVWHDSLICDSLCGMTHWYVT